MNMIGKPERQHMMIKDLANKYSHRQNAQAMIKHKTNSSFM